MGRMGVEMWGRGRKDVNWERGGMCTIYELLDVFLVMICKSELMGAPSVLMDVPAVLLLD